MSALIDDLFSRRLLWVTGKGGVGKSTVAAALALLASQRDQRTLLIDVEGRGDAARFLDATPPGYRPREVRPGLHLLALEPEEVLNEYLKVGMKVPRVYRIGPVSRIFDFIATAAPGVKEVLIAGKAGFEERARDGGRPRWDLIVLDAAPSGQIVSHLRGPRTIQEMVGVGLIRNQTAWVRDIVEDPARSGMVAVALAEEMPVAETSELIDHAAGAVGTPVLAVVANRIVEPPGDLEAVRTLAGAAGLDASTSRALEAAELLGGIAASQGPYLERLEALGPPAARIPLLGWEQHDLAATRLVAEALSGAS